MHVDESVQRNELAVDDPLTPAHDEPEGTLPPEPHEGDNSIADLSMDMHAGDRSGDPLNLIGLPDDDDMDVDDPTPAARPESRYDPKLDEEEEDELVDDVSEKRVMSVELGSGEHPEDAAGTSLKAAENITSGGTLVSEQAAALAGRKYVFSCAPLVRHLSLTSLLQDIRLHLRLTRRESQASADQARLLASQRGGDQAQNP